MMPQKPTQQALTPKRSTRLEITDSSEKLTQDVRQTVSPDTDRAATAKQAATLADTLIRPALRGLTPYQSARRCGGQGHIWLNANESPFNNSELVGANRYPECQPPELTHAYSRYVGVDEEYIVITRGADEAIELLIRTFCTPGQDSIGQFSPTYGMYGISAGCAGVAVSELSRPLPAPESKQEREPEAQLPTPKDKLVFLCNPNNPTGKRYSRQQICTLLQHYPDRLIVVDEAYIEFCAEDSMVSLLGRYANLVVLRTLSKAFALAGIRCGFLLANPAICQQILRIIAPYPIALPVAQMATRALSPAGIATMQYQVSCLNANRSRLLTVMQQLGAQLENNTAGNFVLADFSATPTRLDKVKQALTQAGIVGRSYQHPQLRYAIRLSVGDTGQISSVIAALMPLLPLQEQGATVHPATDSP